MEVLPVSLGGLRQEDPLAPFLFNTVVEGLCSLMRKAINKKLFTSFKVGKSETKVNLLQYAGNIIFIGETTLSYVVVIKCMLRCFKLVFDLKVNFWIVNGWLFLVYLRIPISANPRLEAIWNWILFSFLNSLLFGNTRSYLLRVELVS